MIDWALPTKPAHEVRVLSANAATGGGGTITPSDHDPLVIAHHLPPLHWRAAGLVGAQHDRRQYAGSEADRRVQRNLPGSGSNRRACIETTGSPSSQGTISIACTQ